MLDIKFIRQQPDLVRESLKKRSDKFLAALDQVIVADVQWRSIGTELEPLRAQRNKAADEIGKLKREKKDTASIMKEMGEIKVRVKELEEKERFLEEKVKTELLNLPNLPLDTLVVGKDASENKLIRAWGDQKKFSFKAKDHQTVGESLGILDAERAAKLSGSRFSLLVGPGAKLERALIQFMLDLHTQKNGYTEVFPPFLVNRPTMTGTGQLPKFEEELYACRDDELFLIPTAEVPLTNIYRGEVFKEDQLPQALCAYTACFRREAGSYGKDTRGLIRNHQFNKIELVRFSRPEDSPEQLEQLTTHAANVLEKLGLAYRVMELCTGDMGFSSAKTYDLEVWMPGDTSGDGKTAGSWREISSCSTFTDYQARRIGIRVKGQKSRGFVHTLNGSGVAVGRAMAAVLEVYQQEDGSVIVPEVLRPYMGVEKLTPKKYL